MKARSCYNALLLLLLPVFTACSLGLTPPNRDKIDPFLSRIKDEPIMNQDLVPEKIVPRALTLLDSSSQKEALALSLKDREVLADPVDTELFFSRIPDKSSASSGFLETKEGTIIIGDNQVYLVNTYPPQEAGVRRRLSPNFKTEAAIIRDRILAVFGYDNDVPDLQLATYDLAASGSNAVLTASLPETKLDDLRFSSQYVYSFKQFSCPGDEACSDFMRHLGRSDPNTKIYQGSSGDMGKILSIKAIDISSKISRTLDSYIMIGPDTRTFIGDKAVFVFGPKNTPVVRILFENGRPAANFVGNVPGTPADRSSSFSEGGSIVTVIESDNKSLIARFGDDLYLSAETESNPIAYEWPALLTVESNTGNSEYFLRESGSSTPFSIIRKAVFSLPKNSITRFTSPDRVLMISNESDEISVGIQSFKDDRLITESALSFGGKGSFSPLFGNPRDFFWREQGIVVIPAEIRNPGQGIFADQPFDGHIVLSLSKNVLKYKGLIASDNPGADRIQIQNSSLFRLRADKFQAYSLKSLELQYEIDLSK